MIAMHVQIELYSKKGLNYMIIAMNMYDSIKTLAGANKALYKYNNNYIVKGLVLHSSDNHEAILMMERS